MEPKPVMCRIGAFFFRLNPVSRSVMPDRAVRFRFLVLIVFLLNGCAATLDALQKPPVHVFYATDRSRTGKADPDKFYGHQRGELTYGTCEVTIVLSG